MLVEARLVAENEIFGLEIAVNDPLRVRMRQPGKQLLNDAQGPPHRQAPPGHHLAQRSSGDEVHHQERRAVDAEVGDGNAVRMGEAAHRARLRLEPAQEGLLRGDPGVQKFDRHRAVQLHPLATVDDAHRAGSDLGQDAIAILQHLADPRIGWRR